MDKRKLEGLNIARLRKERGLTQQELGDKAGIPKSYISNMETGQRGLTPDKREALAKALECDIQAFYVDPKPKKPIDPDKEFLMKYIDESFPKIEDAARREMFISEIFRALATVPKKSDSDM